MKTSDNINIITSPLANVVNKKRAFISQRNDNLYTSNLFNYCKNDYRYLNKQISDDLYMYNQTIFYGKEREEEKHA